MGKSEKKGRREGKNILKNEESDTKKMEVRIGDREKKKSIRVRRKTEGNCEEKNGGK